MKSEIIVILDRSGSMSSIASDAIGGFNAFIEEQKKVEGEATVTLAQFDDGYDLIYDNVPLSEVVPLTSDTFRPRGMTALYDAIGRTVNAVSTRISCSQCDSGTKRIVAILTDGQENSSKEYSQDSISKVISHQRDEHDWEFIFLAANQDAFETGGALGIKKGDTFNFAATSDGTRSAYGSMNISATHYRTTSGTK
jgi:uncharacterized protein YegL